MPMPFLLLLSGLLLNTSAPALELWQLPNQTHSQMMSYILKANDGSVIVIDGGTRGDCDYLVKQIREISGDGHVKAWLLSHIHDDHVDALVEYLERGKNELAIDQVFFSFPSLAWLTEVLGAESGEVKSASVFYKAIEAFDKKGPLSPHQPLVYGDVEIQALNDYAAIPKNPINNSTVIYRVKTPKTTLLFLGDMGMEGGEKVMQLQAPEMLKADVVQMAHHGQQGVSRAFYEIVRPTICLWPTPDWLWDNDHGEGPGSGPWKTIQNRAWMDDLGVKKHIVMKDGLKRLEFE